MLQTKCVVHDGYASGMSETNFAPKFAPVKSGTVDKKFPLCQNLTPFPKLFVLLWLKILVLMWQYDTL
jgi:hypothetical protein